jgi:Protein of unknown function (DUF1688)
VRARATELLRLGEAEALPHFRVDIDRIEITAGLVADITRESYPNLAVPPHSRWRHFELDGRDLAAEALTGLRGEERARRKLELAVVSVLLDAGAGPDWTYEDGATGRRFGRSEGLALASLRAFQAGAFATAPGQARADDAALAALRSETLARHFQVRADNPLPGLDGRAKLLRALGRTGRLATFYDILLQRSEGGALPARELLVVLLGAFNAIWPSGLKEGGVALGDVGRHRCIRRADASDRLVPFHKLSQWLAYSLIEPLDEAGLEIAALDGLTGLAEYRNGGLFLDTGVLVPRDPALAEQRLQVADEAVVEWRALTVALLDRLADAVRRKLGLTPERLPLAAVLQGGSWAAGRRLAASLRGGLPPLTIVSDGTIF